MATSANTDFARPLETLKVNKITIADLRASLLDGFRDYFRKPLLSGFFGLVYVLFGLFIMWNMIILGTPWMIIPVAVGFPLIAPFVAAGLYEMSRRYKRGENFTWRDIFTVIFRQQGREMGWMAFVVLFIFWVWVYQVRLLLAVILGTKATASMEALPNIILTTSNGWYFLGIGSIVGTVLASVLFTVTVIAMPVLLDREIDFISAMLLSIKAVFSNLPVMIIWGIIIGVLLFAAMIPAFIGLVLVLPVLGHATWHLYQRTIRDTQAKSA